MVEKFEFLQAAHDFELGKHTVNGWYASEKMDGERCFWDGGISRGLPARMVPWANTLKDDRLKEEVIATGLWTRMQKVIHAPAWFLDQLPPIPLDAELWMGRKGFQHLRKIVSIINRTPETDENWKRIRMVVIDSPDFHQMFGHAMENMLWANNQITLKGTAKDQIVVGDGHYTTRLYELVYSRLMKLPIWNDSLTLIKQIRLPVHTKDAHDSLIKMLNNVVEGGGEGLILRHPGASWVPKRTNMMLKVKPEKDAEGTVIGYRWGRKTDKGGKFVGKMGALTVKWKPNNGKEVIFDLSGFTDQERILVFKDSLLSASILGDLHSGEPVKTDNITNINFPIGSQVTFKYRELTDDGIPKEARYFRKR